MDIYALSPHTQAKSDCIIAMITNSQALNAKGATFRIIQRTTVYL